MKREGILDIYIENSNFIIVAEQNGKQRKYRVKVEEVKTP